MALNENPGIVRQVLVSGCMILMLIGLLMIPFVATEIAIGIAIATGALFLLVKLVMPKKNKDG